jgi:hypothetical protein
MFALAPATPILIGVTVLTIGFAIFALAAFEVEWIRTSKLKRAIEGIRSQLKDVQRIEFSWSTLDRLISDINRDLDSLLYDLSSAADREQSQLEQLRAALETNERANDIRQPLDPIYNTLQRLDIDSLQWLTELEEHQLLQIASFFVGADRLKARLRSAGLST